MVVPFDPVRSKCTAEHDDSGQEKTNTKATKREEKNLDRRKSKGVFFITGDFHLQRCIVHLFKHLGVDVK